MNFVPKRCIIIKLLNTFGARLRADAVSASGSLGLK